MSAEIAKALAGERFFQGMPAARLATIATAGRFVQFPEPRRIFEEGRPAGRFWLILDGTVALDLHLPGRGHAVLETLGPGAVLGWSWMFAPHRWRFGAVAARPVRAVEFDARLVRTLCAVDPDLGYDLTRRFAGVVLDRLQATRLRLLDLYAHPGSPRS